MVEVHKSDSCYVSPDTNLQSPLAVATCEYKYPTKSTVVN